MLFAKLVINVLPQEIEDNRKHERPIPGLVSVVINCCNGAQFLSQAIESVLGQTYPNWEIIFWDNCSSDKSAEIFHSFQDTRLRYFLSDIHTSLYEARNFAIDNASGEFVAFLDVDDWWESDKLEEQLTLFENEDVGLVYGNYWLFDQEKNCKTVGVSGDLSVGNVLDDVLKHFNVGILTVVVRSSVIGRLTGPCDKRLHIIGDFDLFVRLATETEFSCVKTPVATYRWHKGNETKKDPLLQVYEWDLWMRKACRVPVVRKSPGFKRRLSLIKVFQAGVLAEERRLNDALKCLVKIDGVRSRLLTFLRIVRVFVSASVAKPGA